MTAIFPFATFATAIISVFAFQRRAGGPGQARTARPAGGGPAAAAEPPSSTTGGGASRLRRRSESAERTEQEARERDLTYPHDVVFHQSTRMATS